MRKKPLSDSEKMLRFCAKHGITCNRETIWRIVQREERLVEAVKTRLQRHLTESESSSQLSLNLAPKSTWKVI